MRIVAARKHCLRAPDKNAATAGGPMDQGCAALFNPENSSVFLNLLLGRSKLCIRSWLKPSERGLRLNGCAAAAWFPSRKAGCLGELSWRISVPCELLCLALASRNPGHYCCLTAKGFRIWIRRKEHGSEKRRERKGGRSRAGMCVENVFPARVERVAAMTQSD